MGDEIFTVKEVADYLKVNDRTVYRMAAKGTIPAFKIGSSWRFRQEELEQWIAQQHNDCEQKRSVEER